MTSQFHKHAERLGIPRRTLQQVCRDLKTAKQTGADTSLARLMLRHGRLTDEARDHIANEYNL